MKRVSRFLLLLWMMLILSASIAGATAVPFDSAPKLMIMIMLDGFRPDYITMYNTPNLQRLVAEGAWVAEASSVFPAMTTPNQTSFVTGALPRTTGIPNNSRYDRQLDKVIAPLRDNRAVTIAEALASRGWRTASVNHFMLQNRGAQFYVSGDMDDVIMLLETKNPGLVVYYNSKVDSAGHESGPFNQGTRQAVLAADVEIGRLLQALDRLNLAKQTTLVVASDHGMSPNTGTPMSPDLKTILLNTGLKIVNEDQTIRSDTDIVYIASGFAYLYWRNGKKTPEKEAALLAKLRTIEGADIYTAADMQKLGIDSERIGDIVIAPHPGRTLSRPSGSGGHHGTQPEMRSTMLFWGAGIKPATVVHQASITDIVPTLLTLVKVDLPATVDGRPLTSILDLSSEKASLSVAGSYQVKDVAASDMANSGSHPAKAADGSKYSAWKAALGANPAYIAFDYGAERQISTVELVSAFDFEPVGPRECVVEVSADGVLYNTVFSGEVAIVVGGQSYTIKLEQPVKARYLRLTVKSGWNANAVQIAELRAWAAGVE